MKFFVLFFVVSFSIVSCQNREASSAAAHEPDMETATNPNLRPGIVPPPPPPLPSGELESEPTDKVQKELQALEEATQQIIAQYAVASKPGVEVETDRNFQKQILQLDCEDEKYRKMTNFRSDFLEAYPNSNHKKHLEDGALFCLRTFPVGGPAVAKIVYRRTEGGHLDDRMELVTIPGSAGQVFRLALFHHFAKEGYEQLIESEIEGPLIRRKITERYGWSGTREEDLTRQPRTETTQVFQVQGDGTIVLEEEKSQMHQD